MWIHMQKHHRHVLKILSFCNPYQRLVDYGNIKLPSMHQKTCEVQWACSSSTIQMQSIITMTTRTAKISVWSEIILCENVWLNKSPFWMRLRAKVQDNWQETEKVHIPHLGWPLCTQCDSNEHTFKTECLHIISNTHSVIIRDLHIQSFSCFLSYVCM